MKDGQKLWLWRNGDHYLAYMHEYPTEDGGDPLTLGEPVAIAVFRVSDPPASRQPDYHTGNVSSSRTKRQ